MRYTMGLRAGTQVKQQATTRFADSMSPTRMCHQNLARRVHTGPFTHCITLNNTFTLAHIHQHGTKPRHNVEITCKWHWPEDQTKNTMTQDHNGIQTPSTWMTQVQNPEIKAYSVTKLL